MSDDVIEPRLICWSLVRKGKYVAPEEFKEQYWGHISGSLYAQENRFRGEKLTIFVESFSVNPTTGVVSLRSPGRGEVELAQPHPNYEAEYPQARVRFLHALLQTFQRAQSRAVLEAALAKKDGSRAPPPAIAPYETCRKKSGELIGLFLKVALAFVLSGVALELSRKAGIIHDEGTGPNRKFVIGLSAPNVRPKTFTPVKQRGKMTMESEKTAPKLTM